MQAHSSERLNRWLVVLVVGILIVRTARLYGNGMGVFRHIAGMDYAAFYKPGLAAAVEWVKAQHVPTVYALDRSEGRFTEHRFPPEILEERDLYERLCEMIYPVKLYAFREDKARPGDLIVLSASASPIRSTTVVFEQGQLRIVKVTP